MGNYDKAWGDFENAISELENIIDADSQINATKRKAHKIYWIMVAIMAGIAVFGGKNLYKDRVYKKAVSEYESGNLLSAEKLFGEINYKNSVQWQEAINDEMAQSSYLDKDFISAEQYLSKGSMDAGGGPLRCFVQLCLARAGWKEMDYESTLLHYSALLEELGSLEGTAVSRDRVSKMESECHYYIGRVMYDRGDYEAAVRELAASSYSDAEAILELAENALQWSDMVLEAEPVDSETLAGYKRYVLDSSMIKESTYLVQSDGRVNLGWYAFNGDMDTTWQESVEGPGYGEFIEADFGSPRPVAAISFKLGNWRLESLYEENNVPREIELDVDGTAFTVEFPKEMQEFAVFFPAAVPVSKIRFTIVSVYRGLLYDDTVITDIGIYGK